MQNVYYRCEVCGNRVGDHDLAGGLHICQDCQAENPDPLSEFIGESVENDDYESGDY